MKSGLPGQELTPICLNKFFIYHWRMNYPGVAMSASVKGLLTYPPPRRNHRGINSKTFHLHPTQTRFKKLEGHLQAHICYAGSVPPAGSRA